jgi:hypothetical protein
MLVEARRQLFIISRRRRGLIDHYYVQAGQPFLLSAKRLPDNSFNPISSRCPATVFL